MKLTKLRLDNFRCFEHLEISLHPGLTVLVAENGQGKSSVLDALRISLWPFVSSFDLARNAFNDPGNSLPVDDVRLLKKAENDMVRQLPTEIALTGDFGAGSENTWVRYRDSETKRSKIKEKGDTSFLRQWATAVQKQIRDPEAATLDLPVFGYYGTGRLWAQKRLTESSKGTDDTQSIDFYIRTFAYLNCLDPASSYKHFQEWFTLASQIYWEAVMKLLEGKGQESAVKAAEEPLLVVRQAIDSLLQPSTGWHNLEYSHSQEKSLILHHEQHGTLKVEVLSDGIRSVLAMIGDIAYRAYKLNPHQGTEAAREAHGVVLIDEIDMHLHPTWQQRVLGQLQEAFRKIQFIVTTHSPQVLTTVNSDHIRVLQFSEAGFEAKKPEFSPLAHESGDALTKIMGTHREPELPLQESIRSYEQMVRTGHENTSEAQKLRATLDQAGYQIHESDLMTWRFLAARKTGKAG